ncbi:MAG: putative metal-binding motif-containing protein, partial [Planctomycetota bacterium]
MRRHPLLVGVLPLVLLLSGCALDWPENLLEGDATVETDTGEVDVGPRDGQPDGGQECTQASDCASMTPPNCAGAWSCDAGTCVFACANCTDGDGDNFGDGDGCLGRDCDDTRNDVFPGAGEVCDGVDNDCDGLPDEGLGRLTCGLGICRVTLPACLGGTPQSCTPGGGGNEVCGNGLDDDCDGMLDELCACTDGQTQSCWDGPVATKGVGQCMLGIQTCTAGQWGPCTGQVSPTTEICDGED